MQTLTNIAERRNGRLCHWYEAEGRRVLVCDSLLNVLLVIELFSDQELDPDSKLSLLVPMLFAEPETAFEGVSDPTRYIASILYESCGLDVLNEHDHEKKVFDWEEDADRIRASLRMAYGIDWDTACMSMSFKEVCGLLGMLMETKDSTPFGEAVYYRTAEPPKPNKYNEEERKSFLKMREHFALSDAENANDRDASKLFDKIWSEVKNNG